MFSLQLEWWISLCILDGVVDKSRLDKRNCFITVDKVFKHGLNIAKGHEILLIYKSIWFYFVKIYIYNVFKVYIIYRKFIRMSH